MLARYGCQTQKNSSQTWNISNFSCWFFDTKTWRGRAPYLPVNLCIV